MTIKKIGKPIISIYLNIACLILFIIFILGIACPFLISAKSTELVLIGIVLLILTPIIGGWMIYKLIKKGGKLNAKLS